LLRTLLMRGFEQLRTAMQNQREESLEVSEECGT